MNAPLILWIFRALWVSLPFTLLDQLLAASQGTPAAVRIAVQVLFWLLWTVGLGASLVPLPSTLTAVRMIAPCAPLASLCADLFASPDLWGWLALSTGGLATVAVMAAVVGDWFVDGSSYGDERRLALRPPAALTVGPLQLAWLLGVLPLPTGVLLVANRIWVIGICLIVLGTLTAWWAPLALWRLARRWVVFVPAGMTLVDHLALAEPVLIPATGVVRLGPAHVGTEALDLSVHAPGLVLEVTLSEPVELVRSMGRKEMGEPIEVSSLLFVPSRPATLLAHAEARGLAVARD